ncbi:MAG: hypothetical protein ACOC1K_01295 [Nanoarchaeota archaeon]
MPDEVIKVTFREVNRILKKEGVFRIACPDSDMFYITLNRNEKNYWRWRELWFNNHGIDFNKVTVEDFLIREIATKKCRFAPPNHFKKIEPNEIKYLYDNNKKSSFFDLLTKNIEYDVNYAGYHINWWNAEKITEFLNRAGFKKTVIMSKNKSLARPFHDSFFFDNTHPEMSLYIEAYKT